MTIARIERALVAAAYIVATHGPEYAWLMRRLEDALEEAKRDDPVARAKAILEAYGGDTVRKLSGLISHHHHESCVETNGTAPAIIALDLHDQTRCRDFPKTMP